MNQKSDKMRNSTKFLVRILIIGVVINTFACNNKVDEITEVNVEFMNSKNNVCDSLKTLNSLKLTEDILTLNYYGDYSEILVKENKALKEKSKIACSIYAVLNDSVSYLARNLDLPFGLKNILVGKYNPPDRYKSISIIALDFLVGNRKINPDSLTAFTKSQLLKSPFYGMDGINEKGLAIGIASVESQEIKSVVKKERIDILMLSRLILDNAKDVNEAINIAKRYDVFDTDTNTISHHYLIADATGNSVIVEYQDGEMKFLANKNNYQIITNTLVKDKSIKQRNKHGRYVKLYKQLEKNTELENYEAMNLLKNVSWQKSGNGGGTQWSVIYDLKRKRVEICIKNDYKKHYCIGFNE